MCASNTRTGLRVRDRSNDWYVWETVASSCWLKDDFYIFVPSDLDLLTLNLVSSYSWPGHIYAKCEVSTTKTKTNKRQCPFNSVQVQIREGSPEGNKSDHGGKDLWKRCVLSLEWKVEGVIDGGWCERRYGDCDEVICAGWVCMYTVMRWTSRRVNRMRLTEWRRELIPQAMYCG